MHSWVALARWAHLTPALGLLLAVAPPAIGQQPINHIYDALGRLVAVVDPITNEAAIYRNDAVGNLLSITGQSGVAVSLIEFTPTSGPVGTTATIYGTGFTGLISVTAALGAATSSEVFTVGTPGKPTITGFTPTVGGPETRNHYRNAFRHSLDQSSGLQHERPPGGDHLCEPCHQHSSATHGGLGRIAVEMPADRAVSRSTSSCPLVRTQKEHRVKMAKLNHKIEAVASTSGTQGR